MPMILLTLQVKAFLADARPANFRRPASAPAYFDHGSGGGIGGGDDRNRAAGVAGDGPRRPGTAAAALGGWGGGGGGRGGRGVRGGAGGDLQVCLVLREKLRAAAARVC